MLARPEQQRIEVAGSTSRAHKSALGQFMTPASTARFMAGMFAYRQGPVQLLDAGAGLGALTCAMLERWSNGKLSNGKFSVTAYELDDRLRVHLAATLKAYARPDLTVKVLRGDYLACGALGVERGETPFTHAILNPPYKKIGMGSEARAQTQRIGLTVVNLYAAFVGVALAQLAEGGQLVAIIPRSFCNGLYYKPFRQFLLQHAALNQLHLFDSRTHAFKDDAVLQENVIMHWTKGGKQSEVKVSFSTDDTFKDLRENLIPFAAVVKPGDEDAFFHIPEGNERGVLESSVQIGSRLSDLGIQVSTGPVVDFRLREHLHLQPSKGSVPLLYPGHFKGSKLRWPIAGFKKPNAIARNSVTEKWLYSTGTYTVVRRFSSKEEKRRVVASVVSSDELRNPAAIGFENHLNVFHSNKQSLPVDLAWGLFVYLNSSAVDQYFRQFNGHTQVNATDLRNIRYPTRKSLETLGRWAQSVPLNSQAIDDRMDALLS